MGLCKGVAEYVLHGILKGSYKKPKRQAASKEDDPFDMMKDSQFVEKKEIESTTDTS